MNAGAYKGEMKDVVIEATALCSDGSVVVLHKDALDFSYRHSCFTDSDMLVLSAKLLLQKGKKEEIQSRIKEFAQKRRTTQPLEYPSAGSTFKRPKGYFAGKLIMDAGLRGFQVGGAQVSEKHCGFVINTGDATAEDVTELIRQVAERVKAQSGVTLEPEVKLLGEF